MVAGAAALGGFLVTRNSSYYMLGLLVIVLGCVLVLAGAVLLLIFLFEGNWVPGTVRRNVPGMVIAALLLVGNFPACHLAILVAKTWSITVVNQTGMPVDSCVLIDPKGKVTNVGSLEAGDSSTRWVSPGGEGGVKYTATVAGTTITGDAVGYVTSHTAGGSCTVMLTIPAAPMPAR